MRCFFFFKQKTAYEMRISDLSSDVCSSDLLAIANASQACCHVSCIVFQALQREKQILERTMQQGDTESVSSASPVTALEEKWNAAGKHSFVYCRCIWHHRVHCVCSIRRVPSARSEEYTFELQSLMGISFAVFGLTKKQT